MSLAVLSKGLRADILRAVTADLKLTAEAVRLLVEQFGSVSHLAEAIGVTPAQLYAWYDGAEAVPLDKFRLMVDAVAAMRGGTH